MPLMPLSAPCWSFTCTRDRPESARWREHADDPDALLFRHPWGCCRPYQLNAPCIEAVCDSCGIPYLGRHFATAADAATRLTAAGWRTDPYGRWTCDTCLSAPLTVTPIGRRLS